MPKPKPGYKLVKSLFGKYLSIPEDWSQITIKEIVDKTIDNRGKTPPLSDRGYELIEIASITNKSKYPDFSFVTKYVDEQTYNTWFRDGHPKPNDILVSTVGSVGQFVLIKENRGCIAQNIIGLEINEKVDSIFIYYLLNSKYISQYIHSVLMGLAQPSLRVPHFLKCTIHIPPKTEQQKIASILSNVDNLISSYDKTIDSTRKLKTSLMQTLLTRGIGHKKFKKVKWLFGKEIEIPEEWKIEKLAEITSKVLDMNHSMPEKISEGIPFITTGYLSQNSNLSLNIDLNDPEIQYISKYDYDIESKKFNAEVGDILFTRYGTLGISKFIDSDRKFLASYSIALIKPLKEIVSSIFLTLFLNSRLVKEQIEFLREQSSNNNLHLSKINNIKILLPNQKEQILINYKLTNIILEISKLEYKKTSLEKIKKGLMQKLLTGQIRI